MTQPTTPIIVDREDGERSVVPLAREEVVVEKHRVERARVLVHKHVREHEAHIDEPLLDEHVEVERVEVGEFVDEPPEVYERSDGTLVVPCVQEVLVLEKRLLLKEELHIKRVQHTRHARRDVTLREEVLEVERSRATERPEPARPASSGPSSPAR